MYAGFMIDNDDIYNIVINQSNFINFLTLLDLSIADRTHIHEDSTSIAILVVMARLKVAILLTISAIPACS